MNNIRTLWFAIAAETRYNYLYFCHPAPKWCPCKTKGLMQNVIMSLTHSAALTIETIISLYLPRQENFTAKSMADKENIS